MKVKAFRLSFLVVVLTVGLFVPPASADACPTLPCWSILSYCNDLCGGVRLYRQVGECTAADGSTQPLWAAGCYCTTQLCVNS